jgi:hypothetical protein
MVEIPIRFVERTNDGTTSYKVKQGIWFLGKVTRIRPGVWMAEGCSLTFPTRHEAGRYLLGR